ncbi:MAG: glutamine synthetase [Polyangiaceae bacterium]|nr:glutamine synthetase [Polyangiaceae bacterium]
MTESATLDITTELEKSPSPKVKVAITDIDGILRGKYLHKEKFLSAMSGGFGFCNVVFGWDAADVCYDNVRYTGWHTGYPDALARVDTTTYRRVPWDGNVPFFLGDFQDEAGAPLPVCPRSLLKGVLEKARALGFSAKAGLEFEWFNFKETSASLADKKYVDPSPMTPGMFGYSILRMSQNLPFFNALMDELAAFRVPIEGLHTETGPGVLEAAILYSDALEAADRAVLFKTGSREIGQRFGIMPSFMAKWNDKLPGCSGHTHLSLWKDGENAFFDPTDPHRMSATMKSFVAGLLKALPQILPLFAPTVNSYKRLVDGYWAPTKPTWGIDNRTVAVRVIPGSAKSTRIEFRVPGSDINPYLAVAGAIAAGLWGVEHKLTLEEAPVVGSAYAESTVARLPRNLHQATIQMEQSRHAPELLSEAFVEHFVATRHWEWQTFQDAVTDWETRRYFEII